MISMESSVAAALKPHFQSVREIAAAIYPQVKAADLGQRLPNVVSALENLVRAKKAIGEWDTSTARTVYKWLNPHAADVASLQKEFKRIESDRAAKGSPPEAAPAPTPEAEPMAKTEAKKRGRPPKAAGSNGAAKKFKKSIPVEFGGVGVGQGVARIGIKVSRSSLSLDSADELFTNRRLTGVVTLAKDDPKQGKLIADADHEIHGTFDIKGFRVGAETLAAGLSFSTRDIDLRELGFFAKAKGRVDVEVIDELEADDPDEDEDEEGDDEE